MVSRNTTTGRVLEQMILPALEYRKYYYDTQVNIGERFGGGKHIVDIVAKKPTGEKYLISLKWQQVSGTAEQKVPFEAMCLAEAVLSSNGDYVKAYLVLGGEGWKLRNFFIGGGLSRHLRYNHLVEIISLEGFIAKINRMEL